MKNIFVLLFFFLVNVVAEAQSSAMVDKMAQNMTDSLSYLQLTSQQKTSILAINKTAAASLAQAKQRAKTDTAYKGKPFTRDVFKAMKTRNASLQNILTPDQAKTFQQHKVQQLAEMQTQNMKGQLDLTDAQVPQVYAINVKSTTEMMQDKAKLDDSKGKLGKFRAAKSLKSDSKEQDEALKKILSPNQYSEYEKNKAANQDAMKASSGKS